MNELRQYHPNLRVFRIKQSQNDWIFIGDTRKDFAILQSESKMQQVFGKKTSRCHYQGLTNLQKPQKEKFLVFKRVSRNVIPDDFKELLDYNKITHAEAERMNPKDQAETYLLLKSNVTI